MSASELELAKERVTAADAAVGTQRRLVDDLKMHGQDTTEAEVHLRELVQVLEEAQAHLRAMEADAAGAILAGHETKLGSR